MSRGCATILCILPGHNIIPNKNSRNQQVLRALDLVNNTILQFLLSAIFFHTQMRTSNCLLSVYCFEFANILDQNRECDSRCGKRGKYIHMYVHIFRENRWDRFARCLQPVARLSTLIHLTPASTLLHLAKYAILLLYVDPLS